MNYLAEVLGCDELEVKEEQVWQVIVNWSARNNTPLPASLLDTVRFGLMEVQFFRREVAQHPAVEGTEIQEKVDNHHEMVSRLASISHTVRTPSFSHPRRAREVVFSLGGWSEGTALNSISVYNQKFNVWVDLDIPLPESLAYMGSIYYQGCIYLCGGHPIAGAWASNSLWKFDLKSLEFTRLNNMFAGRNYIDLAHQDSCLYVVGGNNQVSRLRTAEKFDISQNQWFKIASMEKIRSDHATVECDGKIYAIGGFDGWTASRSVEAYCPIQNTWTKTKKMDSPRSGVKAVAIKEKIYVIGGWDGIRRLKSGEVFNTKTKTWSEVPDMLCPRSNHALVVLDGQIVAIGGYDGSSTTNQVEAFNLETQTWSPLCALSIKKSAHTVVTVPFTDLGQSTQVILNSKQEYLERRRIAMQRELGIDARNQLMNQLGSVPMEGDDSDDSDDSDSDVIDVDGTSDDEGDVGLFHFQF